MFLKILQYSQGSICVGVFSNEVVGLQLYQKETPTQVFSCEYSIPKYLRIGSFRTPPGAASGCTNDKK